MIVQSWEGAHTVNLYEPVLCICTLQVLSRKLTASLCFNGYWGIANRQTYKHTITSKCSSLLTLCVCLHVSAFTWVMSLHTHIFTVHLDTHSSSLCLCDSTMMAAVVSLLGSWGWGDGLAGKCVEGRCLIRQRWFSLRDTGVAKLCHAEENGQEIKLSSGEFQVVQLLLTSQTCPSPDEESQEWVIVRMAQMKTSKTEDKTKGTC